MQKIKMMGAVLTMALLGGIAAAKPPRVIIETGREVTETRSVGNFNGISTSAGIDAIVRQSPDHSVRISADAAVMPYLKTKVVDGVLVIRYEPFITLPSKGKKKEMKSRVYVSAPEIGLLSASSGGDIRIDGTLRGEKLVVEASSSGDVEGVAEYKRIEATASSSGSVAYKGNPAVNVQTSSGGTVKQDN